MLTEFPLEMMEAVNEKQFSADWIDKIKLQIISDYMNEKRTRPGLTLEYYLMTRLIYAGPKTWYTYEVDRTAIKS